MIHLRHMGMIVVWGLLVFSGTGYSSEYQQLADQADGFDKNYKGLAFFRENSYRHREGNNKNGNLFNSLPVVVGDDIGKQTKVVEFAKKVSFLAQERTLHFCNEYLALKKQHGTDKEKALYQDLPLSQFVERLYCKRPLVFTQAHDDYILRNGIKKRGGFEKLGTDAEEAKKGLILADYISYDEMLISALCGHASGTLFINNGNRTNNMEPSKEGSFEPEGYLAGLVGARFEKPGFMEWKHMVITAEQNIAANGYGEKGKTNNPLLQLWAKFYRVGHFPSFDEIDEKNENFIKIPAKNGDTEVKYLNIAIYKERLRLTIEPFLQEANALAQEKGKKAYVHVIGLGLGAWALGDTKKDAFQEKYMLEVYQSIMQQNNFDYIADIDFSWFSDKAKDHFISLGNINLPKVINIIFSKRNLSAKLTGNDEGKLLVAMYPWDGNAFVGNEYWGGSNSFCASSDPAAAACSLISILQNPKANPWYKQNIIKFVENFEKPEGKREDDNGKRQDGKKTVIPSSMTLKKKKLMVAELDLLSETLEKEAAKPTSFVPTVMKICGSLAFIGLLVWLYKSGYFTQLGMPSFAH
jgi:hypothetical protein